MIIQTSSYVIRSDNSNSHYWEQGRYPSWAKISLIRYIAGQKKGAGVEPHYHDNDEVWHFVSGHGETWLDGQAHQVSPNTVVYTPMGVVHRFQMFTDFGTVAIVTPLERQMRGTHLLVEEDGPPVKTAPGFVVPGETNDGPFRNRGGRSALSELRAVSLAAGQSLVEGKTSANEYWLGLDGAIRLTVEGFEIELTRNDVAILRAGVVRKVRTDEDARVALARE